MKIILNTKLQIYVWFQTTWFYGLFRFLLFGLYLIQKWQKLINKNNRTKQICAACLNKTNKSVLFNQFEINRRGKQHLFLKHLSTMGQYKGVKMEHGWLFIGGGVCVCVCVCGGGGLRCWCYIKLSTNTDEQCILSFAESFLIAHC